MRRFIFNASIRQLVDQVLHDLACLSYALECAKTAESHSSEVVYNSTGSSSVHSDTSGVLLSPVARLPGDILRGATVEGNSCFY